VYSQNFFYRLYNDSINQQNGRRQLGMGNQFMNQTHRYNLLVTQSVGIGYFLLGFAATFISGTVPFMNEHLDLNRVSGDLKLGWSAVLSCGLPIMVTLTGMLFFLWNHQQTAVILERLPRPRRRLPSGGANE
jgi:hypothetical protein